MRYRAWRELIIGLKVKGCSLESRIETNGNVPVQVTEFGVIAGKDGKLRCDWCTSDPLYQAYHDQEWAIPEHNDTLLFEKLCLEGFQSGLSWLTILRKRESFRRAFAGFDLQLLSKFKQQDVQALLQNSGIVRHRGKIEATIHNAQCALRLLDSFGSLDQFFWRFEPPASERPFDISSSTFRNLSKTPTSERLAKELKRLGFRFLGPTTAYAFMQAVGLVNDHMDTCDYSRKVQIV